ncbi:hypothetical protein [Lactococcus cremoris]|nr:hypothetical protein [Lactococcus cremoris]
MAESKKLNQICDNCKGRFDFVMNKDYTHYPPYHGLLMLTADRIGEI